MTDAEYQEVIRLQLRKPKSWERQLSTYKSSPHITLPLIQLYNSKGQLLLEARDNGEARSRIWQSSTIQNKELHPNAKRESRELKARRLKICESDTFGHNYVGDNLRSRCDTINREDKNRQPHNKIKSSGGSLDNSTTKKTADIRENGNSVSNATKTINRSVKTHEILDNCLKKSKSDTCRHKDDLSSKDSTLKRHSAQSFREFVQNAQERHHRRPRSGDLFGRKWSDEESIKRAQLDGYRNFITPNIRRDKSLDEPDKNRGTFSVVEKALLDNNTADITASGSRPKRYGARTCSAGSLIISEKSFNGPHCRRLCHRDSGIGDDSVRSSVERQASDARDAGKSKGIGESTGMARHARQASDPTDWKSKNYTHNRYPMVTGRNRETSRDRYTMVLNRINPNVELFYSHSDVFPFNEIPYDKIDGKLNDSCNYIVEEPVTPTEGRENSGKIIEKLNRKKHRKGSDGSTSSNTITAGEPTKGKGS